MTQGKVLDLSTGNEGPQMFDLSEQWGKIWSTIRGRPAEITRSVFIPADHVLDSGVSSKRFEPRNHYFAVAINELFLAQSRQWWNEYDPMALVVSEFTYDGKRTTVPIVV